MRNNQVKAQKKPHEVVAIKKIIPGVLLVAIGVIIAVAIGHTLLKDAKVLSDRGVSAVFVMTVAAYIGGVVIYIYENLPAALKAGYIFCCRLSGEDQGILYLKILGKKGNRCIFKLCQVVVPIDSQLPVEAAGNMAVVNFFPFILEERQIRQALRGKRVGKELITSIERDAIVELVRGNFAKASENKTVEDFIEDAMLSWNPEGINSYQYELTAHLKAYR